MDRNGNLYTNMDFESLSYSFEVQGAGSEISQRDDYAASQPYMEVRGAMGPRYNHCCLDSLANTLLETILKIARPT